MQLSRDDFRDEARDVGSCANTCFRPGQTDQMSSQHSTEKVTSKGHDNTTTGNNADKEVFI